jgi:hypothetical protein
MTHLKDESLSALIDGEVEEQERALMQSHLEQCSECSARRQRLQAAGAAMASIQEVAPSMDETRALRQVLLARRPTRWARLAPATWAAVGGVAVLLVAFLTFATLRRPSEEKTTAAPERATPTSETITISSDNEELLALVRSDSGIQTQVGKYRVSDVRSKQQEALADYGAAAPAAAPAESAQRQAADSATPAATASPLPDRSLGYCVGAWVDLRSNPTIPLAGRPADFQGQPAWLLVYAYSASNDPEAKLNLLTVLVVRRAGCERDDAILRLLSIGPSPAP